MGNNKKDERIKKMIERGITNTEVIARKLGYQDMEEGIRRVEEGIKRLSR
jgi:imidazolonepropionase-like amidohydrolase